MRAEPICNELATSAGICASGAVCLWTRGRKQRGNPVLRSWRFKLISLMLVGCQPAKFGKPTLYAADTAPVGFGEFRDGNLSVKSIGEPFVFFWRPRLAMVGGKTGRSTTVLWLWGGRLTFCWRLSSFRKLSRLSAFLARKVRDEQLDFVAKTVEVGWDCGGVESVGMSGVIANFGDHSNGAS